MQSNEWPIEALQINHGNPRRDVRNDPDYPGLLASIEGQGILQPLLINKEGKVLAGHRRYAAALDLGMQRVPVRVVPDKNNHTLVPLIENLQRKDLAVMEIADYLLACRNDHGLTNEAMSQIVGLSLPTISKYMKLAEGPAEIRERIDRDDIPLGAAFALLGHDREFIREVIQEPVLTREIVRQRASVFGTGKPRPETWKSQAQSPAPLPAAITTVKCPTERKAHLEYAIKVIGELLQSSPDEVFVLRYSRWLNIMGDDLADEEAKQDLAPTFSGATNVFQRQPKQRTVTRA